MSGQPTPNQSTALQDATQYKNWFFPSQQHLQQLKQSNHDSSINKAKSMSAAAAAADNSTLAMADSLTPLPIKRKTKDKERALSSPDYLTLQEDESLQHYYLFAIDAIAAKFNPPLPFIVQATAKTFFRRFYLHSSVIFYHPQSIAAVAIYLACKCEEYYHTTQRIAEITKTTNSTTEQKIKEIVALEIPLLEGIKFNLRVYHPFKTIDFWCKFIKSADKNLLANIESIEATNNIDFQSACNILCLSTYTTDVNFLFTHSQVGLAIVLFKAEQFSILEPVQSLFQQHFSASNSLQNFENFLSVRYSAMKTYFSAAQGAKPDANAAKIADKKLKKCRVAEFDPLSAEFERLKTAELAQRDEFDQRAAKKRREEAEEKIKELVGGGNSGKSGGNNSGGGGGLFDDFDGEEEEKGFVISRRASTDEETAQRAARIAAKREEAERQYQLAGGQL
jgi:cyclin H